MEEDLVAETRRLIAALDNVIQTNRRQRLHPEYQSSTMPPGPILSDQFLLFAHTLRRDFGVAEARYNEGQVEAAFQMPDNRLRQVRHRIQAPPPAYQDTYHIPSGPVVPQRHQSCQIENWWIFDINTQVSPEDFDADGVIGKCRNVRKTQEKGSGLSVCAIRRGVKHHELLP